MEIRHPEDRDDIEDIIRIHGLGWREAYQELLPERALSQIPVEPSEETDGSGVERTGAG